VASFSFPKRAGFFPENASQNILTTLKKIVNYSNFWQFIFMDLKAKNETDTPIIVPKRVDLHIQKPFYVQFCTPSVLHVIIKKITLSITI